MFQITIGCVAKYLIIDFSFQLVWHWHYYYCMHVCWLLCINTEVLRINKIQCPWVALLQNLKSRMRVFPAQTVNNNSVIIWTLLSLSFSFSLFLSLSLSLSLSICLSLTDTNAYNSLDFDIFSQMYLLGYLSFLSIHLSMTVSFSQAHALTELGQILSNVADI